MCKNKMHALQILVAVGSGHKLYPKSLSSCLRALSPWASLSASQNSGCSHMEVYSHTRHFQPQCFVHQHLFFYHLISCLPCPKDTQGQKDTNT